MSYTGEYKVSIIFGYALWAVGLGLLSTLDEETSTARFAGFLILTGLGQGQSLQTCAHFLFVSMKLKDLVLKLGMGGAVGLLWLPKPP